MSSNDAAERTNHSEDTVPSQGTKRDADSLFVDAEEHVDDTGGRGKKRLKPNLDIDGLLAALDIDADGNVAAYNSVQSEGRPRLAIYHDSFKAAEQVVPEICGDFMTEVEQVKANGYECPEISHICEHNLKPFLTPQAEYPLVGPIALLGPAGIGKSSFTGCILDSRGSAPESDGTKRGTNVVHEYSAAMTSQKALFQVGAVYYSEDQVRDLVKTHCGYIFKFLNQSDKMEEDEADDLQKQYENSVEFFYTLLCDQDDFESIEDAQGYFDERKEDVTENVIGDLTALIEAFKGTRGLQDGVEYHLAETNEELAEIFKLVSRAPKAGGRQQPHPWPLVVKVEIHQEKDILNAGVVLADCPGITDSNQGVVTASMNYLKQAGTILIFEKIERIKDNPALDANIRACIRIGKRSNIRLIVTMIDLKQHYKPEELGELSYIDRRMLSEAERVVDDLKAKKVSLKHAKANATGDEYKAIDKAYEDIPIKIAIAEARLDQLNIEIRNRDVAEHLRGKIRQLERSPNSPDLPVFFISNTQYQQHLKGYDPTKPPSLDVKGTGVPLVRNMLFEIPARGKSNTMQRICCTALPVTFYGILGILSKSPLARKEEVVMLIEKVLREHVPLLDRLEDDVKDLFNRHITAVITASESKWSDKAANLVGSWEKYKAATFLAFCRRSGHWRTTPGEQNISWNNKIQKIFEGRLVDAFNALENDIARTGTNAVTNIKELFSKLCRELEECEDFQGNTDAMLFFALVRHTRDSLNKEVRKLFESFTDQVAVIRNATILEDEDKSLDSYVSLAMQDTYDTCEMMPILERKKKKDKTGSGSKVSKKTGIQAKRVDAVRQRLLGTDQEKSIFAAVSDAASEAFEEILAVWKQECQQALESGCQAIVQDFDRRFVVSDVKAEENTEAVEALKVAATKAVQRVEGELKQHVEAFEAYEKGGGAMK